MTRSDSQFLRRARRIIADHRSLMALLAALRPAKKGRRR